MVEFRVPQKYIRQERLILDQFNEIQTNLFYQLIQESNSGFFHYSKRLIRNGVEQPCL